MIPPFLSYITPIGGALEALILDGLWACQTTRFQIVTGNRSRLEMLWLWDMHVIDDIIIGIPIVRCALYS